VPKDAKRFDVADWARSTKRPTGGSTCTLCAAVPGVREAIATILDMRKHGQTSVSQAQVCKMLAAEYKLRVAPTTLHRHVTLHLEAKW
jgi:hypothetical protein